MCCWRNGKQQYWYFDVVLWFCLFVVSLHTSYVLSCVLISLDCVWFVWIVFGLTSTPSTCLALPLDIPALTSQIPALAPKIPALAPKLPALAPQIPALAPNIPALAPRIPALALQFPHEAPESRTMSWAVYRARLINTFCICFVDFAQECCDYIQKCEICSFCKNFNVIAKETRQITIFMYFYVRRTRCWLFSFDCVTSTAFYRFVCVFFAFVLEIVVWDLWFRWYSSIHDIYVIWRFLISNVFHVSCMISVHYLIIFHKSTIMSFPDVILRFVMCSMFVFVLFTFPFWCC